MSLKKAKFMNGTIDFNKDELKTDTFKLRYGPMARTPEEQLRQHGLTLGNYAKKTKNNLESLYHLRLELLLSDREYYKILRKIDARIVKRIEFRNV